MLNLKNITLVCMSSVNIEDSIKALQISSKQIEFSSVKFISHIKPTDLANIEHCHIDQMTSLDSYSYNMIYNLEKYIDTDFALVVQADGYVINPDSWKNEFLEYDYIGAPFPLPKDSFSYRDIYNNIIRIGNGGFSLRSKKLIQLANKLKLPWEPFHGYYNEDGFICAKNRHIYEQNGIKFAPLEIAKYFSHETILPEFNNIIPFGFHGKNSRYKLL